MNKPVKRNILLNPGPATTTDSVKYAQVVPDICPREKEFCILMNQIREKLVRVVNGDDRYTAIPFASSGTGAMDACISSVLAEGKKILVVNNGAYGKRMVEIARTYYGNERVVVYELPWGDYPQESEVERILSRDGAIAAIVLVHHETTTGMLNPVENITRIAHKRDVDVVVDTVSSYAGIVIDVRKHDIDYLFSTSNKCIQGMAGISFVICKKDKLKKTASNPVKNYYFNLFRQFSYFEKTGEMQYTPPVQIAYALDRALDEFFDETAGGRSRRYADSWKALVEGLKALGFTFLVPMEQQSKLLTAVIEPADPHYEFTAMHDYLFERGFTIYPGKGAKENTFRVANIGAIDKEDIGRFLDALRGYLKEAGVAVM